MAFGGENPGVPGFITHPLLIEEARDWGQAPNDTHHQCVTHQEGALALHNGQLVGAHRPIVWELVRPLKFNGNQPPKPARGCLHHVLESGGRAATFSGDDGSSGPVQGVWKDHASFGIAVLVTFSRGSHQRPPTFVGHPSIVLVHVVLAHPERFGDGGVVGQDDVTQ